MLLRARCLQQEVHNASLPRRYLLTSGKAHIGADREKEGGYSVFDSALYRNLDAKWLFPQEKAAL
jgi:hypothetical protein